MRVLLAVVVAVVVAVAVPRAQAPSAEGRYLVHGSGLNRPYAGYVQVDAHEGLLRIQWELEDGSHMIAVGFVDGDVLSMLFQDDSGRIGYGYYRFANGEWSGRWSGPGAPQSFPETWTKTTLTLEQYRKRLTGPRVGA